MMGSACSSFDRTGQDRTGWQADWHLKHVSTPVWTAAASKVIDVIQMTPVIFITAMRIYIYVYLSKVHL